jgi:hypothetical protein
MTRRPTYHADGFRPSGPGGVRCNRCGVVISSNALARASHRRKCDRERAAELARNGGGK